METPRPAEWCRGSAYLDTAESLRKRWAGWKENICYNALGTTGSGRYLSVFFIRKLDNKALITTARDMNKNERKRYEKK